MESDRKSYLSVENLNVSCDKNHVLEDISFQIERDHFVCVIGPNGGGKSALLKALGGLLPIRSGLIRFAISLGRMLGQGKLIRPATSQLDRV
jgi:ABC-type cobalamin/Fe3+-siderophores transport system ATPase subunit